jgi:hypothetical protein
MTEAASARDLSKNESDITTLMLAADHPAVRKALRNEIEKETGLKYAARQRTKPLILDTGEVY